MVYAGKLNSNDLFMFLYGASLGNSSPFRFILNYSDVVATNSYLMLYPKPGLAHLIFGNATLLNKV